MLFENYHLSEDYSNDQHLSFDNASITLQQKLMFVEPIKPDNTQAFLTFTCRLPIKHLDLTKYVHL